MNVTWVHYGAIVGSIDRAESALASGRLRVLVPGRELARRGHTVRLARFHSNADEREILNAAAGDVVVISKLSSTCAVATRYFARKTMSVMQRLRQRGVRVLVDLSDFQFEKPELTLFMQSLPSLCDGLIACTQELADEVASRTGLLPQVIDDPVEAERGEARGPRAEGPLRVLWFGHQSNLAILEEFLPVLREQARRMPLSLHVVTAENSGAEALGDDGPLTVSFTPWSSEAQAQALAQCDVVLIPSRLDTAVQRSKSANRLVAAAWGGRFAVASPVPSYLPLGRWMWLGDDLTAGLEFARSAGEEIVQRIAAAQDYIAQHNAPARIADRWEQVLSEAVERAPAHSSTAADVPDAPIYVHLGNGTGRLDGWINIHLEPARAQPPPDMVCDLNDLVYLADASVDGVAALQVLQHFTPSQVPTALREWLRVLRPGASLAIESPDLQALCRRVGEGTAPDATVQAALFGQPARHGTRLPYRSGYTEQGLSALLARAGFERIRREPPCFTRNEWMMRIVADKPSAGRD